MTIILNLLVEGALDPRPVLDRPLLARCNGNHDLAPAGTPQSLDPLFQLLLAGGEGGAPDQLGGEELASYN